MAEGCSIWIPSIRSTATRRLPTSRRLRPASLRSAGQAYPPASFQLPRPARAGQSHSRTRQTNHGFDRQQLRPGSGAGDLPSHPLRLQPATLAHGAARSPGQFPFRAQAGTLRILRLLDGGDAEDPGNSVACGERISYRRVQRSDLAIRGACEQCPLLGGGLLPGPWLGGFRSHSGSIDRDEYGLEPDIHVRSTPWPRSGGSGSSTTTWSTSRRWRSAPAAAAVYWFSVLRRWWHRHL